jgi:hypothetical protein
MKFSEALQQDSIINYIYRNYYLCFPRLAIKHNQSLTQWMLVAISLSGKGQTYESDHSFPPTAKVKNTWKYTTTFPYIFIV